MTLIDKILEDLIEGASRNKGANIEVARENHGYEMKLASITPEKAYLDGIDKACKDFGVKQAFLPMLGSLAGGMLGGKMLGKVAPKLMGSTLARGAADIGGSMLGQSLGEAMQGRPR